MSVQKLEKSSRALSGIIETGQYGIESNFINVTTKKSVYRRKKQDAEMLPFYFYVEIPEGTEDGLLILQRTAAFGIRRVLHWILKLAFENKNPDLRPKFMPLVASTEIDKFVKGKIQQVNFVRKIVPADIADSFRTGNKEVNGIMELVIKARKGSILPVNEFIASIFKSRKVSGIFALDEDQKFPYENIKAKVKVGQSTRTINAADPGRIRSYYDITDAVKIGAGGHPVYDSIKEQAQTLASRLGAALNGSGTL